MAKLLQTLIPILLLAAAAHTAWSQPPSSTSFHYDFGVPHSTGLTFQGDAHFLPLFGSTFLRLTDPVNNTVGRVVYTNPVQFWQEGGQVDFETTFTFLITPNEGKLPADGLVFFIAPVGTTPPLDSDGGNFGVFSSLIGVRYPKVFAVEFDTFVDKWDPHYRHIGIDIGTSKSLITRDVGDAIVGKPVTARISYAAATGMITVVVYTGSETFELRYEYDLSDYLTEQVQVGLSAATGQEMAAHDIYSWYFTANMVNTSDASAMSRKPFIRQFV